MPHSVLAMPHQQGGDTDHPFTAKFRHMGKLLWTLANAVYEDAVIPGDTQHTGVSLRRRSITSRRH